MSPAPDAATVRQDRAPLDPSAVALRVTSGPDAGASLIVASDGAMRFVVGTSAMASLRLTDPHVSRRHLVVGRSERGIFVHDLDSTNGTFVRGVRVREAWVVPGEPIAIGETTLLVEWAESTSTTLPEEADAFGRMLGRTSSMRRLFALATRLAQADVPVLIEGESGTGKELLAEELHARGRRSENPFVIFDGFRDDPQQAAASLFGVGSGLVASSPDGRPGLLETANGGTLLIDRPNELGPDLQRRLARALSRREVQRVGSELAIPVDVRIIATSPVDLDRLVERGEFREDLFYSLAGARLEIPPLRERREDIELLTEHFWSTAGARHALPDALRAHFVEQPWPGNVRELENAVARHLATGELEVGAHKRASFAPAPPSSAPPSGDFVSTVLAQRLPLSRARQEILATFERLYVEQVLRDHGGNVTHAARASGLAHRYFQALKAKRTR